MKRMVIYTFKENFDKLQQLNGTSENIVKFRYFVAKNLQQINNHISCFEKARQTFSEKEIEYENKRLEIIRNFAEKDENGNLIQNNNMVTIPKTSMPEYLLEVSKLEVLYAVEIKSIAEKTKIFDTFLDEELENNLDIFNINLEYIPNDITSESMGFLVENNFINE